MAGKSECPRACATCNKNASKKCPCGVPYCSTKCQTDAWKTGHPLSAEHQFCLNQRAEFVHSNLETEKNSNLETDSGKVKKLLEAVSTLVEMGLLHPNTPLPRSLPLSINALVVGDAESARRLLHGNVVLRGELREYRLVSSYVRWKSDESLPSPPLSEEDERFLRLYGSALQNCETLTIQLTRDSSGLLTDAQRKAIALRKAAHPTLWDKAFPNHDPNTRDLLCSTLDLLEEGRSAYNKLMELVFYVAPSAQEVPRLMAGFDEALRRVQKGTDFVDDLAALMIRLFAIHPFACGNGRTARILANLLIAREYGTHALLLIGNDDALKRAYDEAVVECIRRYDNKAPIPAGEQAHTPFARFLREAIGAKL